MTLERPATQVQEPLNAGEVLHLFVVSSRDATGEMAARSYDYQDPACSDPWFEGDETFLSTVTTITRSVREHVEPRPKAAKKVMRPAVDIAALLKEARELASRMMDSEAATDDAIRLAEIFERLDGRLTPATKA